MQPISPQQHQIIVNHLLNGDSIRTVVKKSGVSKSTVGRISKEVLPNKENINMGRPSKLSAQVKWKIVNKITSGELDNAVQATTYINSINPNPVSPMTVRRCLKKEGMQSVTKKKAPGSAETQDG